jgi:hypothetical protein
MRRTLLPIAMLLLCATWAVAQYGGGYASQSQPDANKVSVAGCLDMSNGIPGNFILTDASGAVYQLTGKTEKLKDHVGQTIRVTAIGKPVVNVPGAMSEGTGALPTLSVISFKRLSGVCQGASNNN